MELDVLRDIKIYSSDKKEGFVLNIDGFMVKVKCDDYVQIHKTISSLSSTNGIIKAIADDTFDDFISKVPEAYKERILKVSRKVYKYIYDTDKTVKSYYYDGLKQTEGNGCLLKDFMIYVDKNVPKELQGYVRNEYFHQINNYIKSRGKCPHYKNMNEMGLNDENE